MRKRAIIQRSVVSRFDYLPKQPEKAATFSKQRPFQRADMNRRIEQYDALIRKYDQLLKANQAAVATMVGIVIAVAIGVAATILYFAALT